MSATTVLVLVIVGIVFAVFMGFKFNHNVGLWCYIFAWLIGCFGLGLKPSALVKMWPTTFTFIIMSVSAFYGYLQENGALVLLAKKILYKFRNSTWALPWIIFILSFALAMSGAGAVAGTAVLAPIAFTICMEAGISPLLAIAAVMLPSPPGALCPWGTGGALPRGCFEGIPALSDIAYDMCWPLWINGTIVAIILFLVCYFVFKGFKVKKVTMAEPEPFTKNQKTTLYLALAVAVLVIVPALAKLIFKLKWAWLGAMDIQFIALTAAMACFLLKLGDEKKIIRNRIPWSIIFMVVGVTCLMGVAEKGGVLQLLADKMSSGMSNNMITATLSFIAGFMSFFSGGMTVVSPMLLPMVEPLWTATGISPITLAGAICFGANTTGMSPFSTGGAICLGFYPNEEDRNKIFLRQFLMTCGCWILLTILSFLGFFGLLQFGLF